MRKVWMSDSRSHRGCMLLLAAAAMFLSPGLLLAVAWPLDPPESDLIGELVYDHIRPGDTLVSMARMHNIGYREMREANRGVPAWIPEDGTRVLVPQLHVLPDAPREGIVINLGERRLYYYPPKSPTDFRGPVVITHPIGIGLLDRATPTGQTRVAQKLDNPAWYPTPATRAWYAARGEALPSLIPPGPDNPLGEHALLLERKGYLIHGTHKPAGVGMRVSQGCVRLYPESIRSLMQQVDIGTPVTIIDQRVKAGLRNGTLYVEVHPDEREGAELEAERRALIERIQDLERNRGGELGGPVDWVEVEEAFARADGIPVAVSGQGEPIRTAGR